MEETKRDSCHQWRTTSKKEIIWRNMLLQRNQKLISKGIYKKWDQKCSWYKKWKLVFLKKYLKWILRTSVMTKLKVERMTCQNTCSSWITYQKDAEFTWMCQFSDWRSNWRYCWKLQSYQKIKGCIPTNNQRWSSQTSNLKIRVIQWIKIEDQPQQILRAWFKVRCVHLLEWIYQDLQVKKTKKNDVRCFKKQLFRRSSTLISSKCW